MLKLEIYFDLGFISILQLVKQMAEKPKDIEKYFENSKCKICGVVVQPHFQGNTKIPKEEHLAEKHNFAKHQFGKT